MLTYTAWRPRSQPSPSLRLQRQGIAQGWFTEEALPAIESEAAAAVDEAVRFAHASPFPPVDLIEEMVYADS